MQVNNKAGSWLFKNTRNRLPAVLLLSVLNALMAGAYLWLALLSKDLLEAAQTVLSQDTLHSVWDCLRLPALYIPTLTVVAVVLATVVLHIVTSHFKVYTTGKVEMQLRERVFGSLLHADYTAIHTYHSGELITRLTSDITVVAQNVVGLLPAATSLLAKLIGGVAVLAVLAPDLTLVIMAVGAVAVIGSRIYGARLKALHKQCQQAYGKTRSFIQEIFSRLLSVKVFGNEAAVGQQMNEYQDDYFRWKLRRNRTQLVGSTGLYLLLTAAYYIILLWCVFCLALGAMTVGTLTALLQIFEQLQAPMRSASGLLPQYYAMLASAERLQQIDEILPESSAELPAPRAAVAQGFRRLCLSDVSFAYDEDIPILRGVNLAIALGECVALVGASGIGKSTLMKLVLAIHPCNHGNIVFDGDIPVQAGAATRCLTAYVPQGNALIGGTLRENVAFFRTVTDDQVRKAMSLACLDEFVESLPNGLDTPIGENGIGVSEGQAQRIAIARALLQDAPLLLLDECTSALDAVTEERVVRNLRGLQNKAILLISHKDTTVAGSDRVWRLEEGELVEITA